MSGVFVSDDLEGYSSVEERNVYGVENSSMFLECSSKSQRALIYWQLQKPGDERKLEVTHIWSNYNNKSFDLKVFMISPSNSGTADLLRVSRTTV